MIVPAAGGELFLNGYITDDARFAVGRVTINSVVGHDLVIFAKEFINSENSRIHVNLMCFVGNIQIKGEVIGKLGTEGADVLMDGTIKETSKILIILQVDLCH